MKDNLRGYSVTTTTALKPDLELDIEGIRSNVDRYLALPGVNGLYIGSLYQEFWTQTLEERKRVTETMLTEANGRVPTIVNVSHTSYKDTIDLAKHAQSCGADLVMVWPPYYGPRNDDGILGYYKKVADSLDIGLCAYSATFAELGFYITPELMAKIAEIETVVAVKEASFSLDRFSAMMQTAGHLVEVSAPLEEYYFFGKTAFPEVTPKFIIGSSRPIYMQTAEKPNCAEFWAAIESDDMDAARKSLDKILRVANELHSKYLAKGTHHATLMKYITSLYGFAAGPVRPPLTMPTEAEKENARNVLAANGLLPSEQILHAAQ
ncbi:dihydrodipicolinate synthase family protein [Acuticoccus sp. I52.16.1]|uniref:dihydrodipicolinate synthase family protein n=1 Tax=Acuticoccus sp. I52.16.1 TaxID=2928472 RepID=UPI001FD47D87|nr:dihydrodipicolinate synthase family protein [Acuticoccus sp. I52.16.1]UOM36562.1 dihydrodipicolinate synthase family protein [Acuticoccus sp. I52.16.1]